MLEIARVCMDCGRLYGCRENKVDGEVIDCMKCSVPSIRTVCITEFSSDQTHGICWACKARRLYGS